MAEIIDSVDAALERQRQRIAAAYERRDKAEIDALIRQCYANAAVLVRCGNGADAHLWFELARGYGQEQAFRLHCADLGKVLE